MSTVFPATRRCSQNQPLVMLVLLLAVSGCSRGQSDNAAQRSESQRTEARDSDALASSDIEMSDDPTRAPSPPDGVLDQGASDAAVSHATLPTAAPPTSALLPPAALARPRISANQPRIISSNEPRITSSDSLGVSAAPHVIEDVGRESAAMAPPTAMRLPRTLSPPIADTPMIERAPMAMAADDSPRMEIAALEMDSVLAPNAVQPGAHLSHLPAGAQRHAEQGFATVEVFYATDRQRGSLPLSAYEVTGHKQAFIAMTGATIALFLFAGLSCLRGRSRTGGVSALMGSVTGCVAGAVVVLGQANIEKHGVTYSVDRGVLTRGLCEVTVPDSHRRGLVERPSLLRFEIREDQRDHIVLTSAVELAEADFHTRLAHRVQDAPASDLLVFVHGFNVDFESAVRRTAQIAVDLPFEGVPVCYSWPSQGSLIGYSVDENNAQWTVPHLKQFLLELAQQSGATSINVVAHSMGTRAMTTAMRQISWDLEGSGQVPFDRIVLAAPDIDADRFRRDLALPLLNVANQVTLYASSDDQALLASKQVHGYPRAGESGENIVVVPGIETIDVSGIDLSLLGHSYYGDNASMLRDLYEVIQARLPAPQRGSLVTRNIGPLVYWELAQRQTSPVIR